jgi:hypothetical protein
MNMSEKFSLVVTAGDDNNAIALPYSAENLSLLLTARALYRTSSWRGTSEYAETDNRLHYSIIANTHITPLSIKTDIPSEEKI